MAGPDRIEGCAIVSSDGMLADARGIQPDALKPEADQRQFHATLERADAVAHGRNSSEGGPAEAGRKRLILTRRIAAVAPHPDNPLAVLWNPNGATLETAWTALGLSGGMLIVVGGTEPFGLFLPRFDSFDLTRAPKVSLPGGRPVFPSVPDQTPERILQAAGLSPSPEQILDPADGITLVRWHRR